MLTGNNIAQQNKLNTYHLSSIYRVVFFEDLLDRPAVELEKIITFAGMDMPVREELLKYSQVMRQKLISTYSYVDKRYLGDPTQSILVNHTNLKSAIDAFEEELYETKLLSM
jgi:hypothetical protein